MRQTSIPAINVSGSSIFRGHCHQLITVNTLMKNICPIKKEVNPIVK